MALQLGALLRSATLEHSAIHYFAALSPDVPPYIVPYTILGSNSWICLGGLGCSVGKLRKVWKLVCMCACVCVFFFFLEKGGVGGWVGRLGYLRLDIGVSDSTFSS